MLAVVLLGIAVGLDNLRAGLSIGALNLPRAQQRSLALVFGLCEALMPLVGLAGGHVLQPAAGRWAAVLGPLALGLCGVYVIVLSFRKEDPAGAFASRWVLWGLPLSLSFDNLFAGIGLGLLGYRVLLSALVIGLLSSLLSYLGLRLGGWIARFLPLEVGWVSGTIMVVLAVAMLVWGTE
jgi:putative Mn2+ efflux pump MntP